MNYPLDKESVSEHFAYLLNHNEGQDQLITKLVDTLKQAISETEDEDTYWQEEAAKLLKDIANNKIQHETRRFNEDNVKKARGMKVEKPVVKEMPKIARPPTESELNAQEAKFGPELTVEFLETYFNEREIRNKKRDKAKAAKDVSKMKTVEEIEAWEKEQNDSNDIYRVKARVANLARDGGAALTPVGEMMVNTFVHVLMDLYKFADTIEDKELKMKLIEKVKKHENMPGSLIAATKANVKVKATK